MGQATAALPSAAINSRRSIMAGMCPSPCRGLPITILRREDTVLSVRTGGFEGYGQCLVWVNRVGFRMFARSLLYPQLRTFAVDDKLAANYVASIKLVSIRICPIK